MEVIITVKDERGYVEGEIYFVNGKWSVSNTGNSGKVVSDFLKILAENPPPVDVPVFAPIQN